MEKIIGFCGLICSECPAYLATQKDDDNERKKCLVTEGKLFSHCKVCEIRKCGLEKNLKNCAYCEDFACERLSKFFEMAPEAKTTLEKIRKDL
jgi:hypothetical protein